MEVIYHERLLHSKLPSYKDQVFETTSVKILKGTLKHFSLEVPLWD